MAHLAPGGRITAAMLRNNYGADRNGANTESLELAIGHTD
jgi:hypothetical protein